MLGDQGLVWNVDASALPLEAGSIITLTIGDAYYQADLSVFSGSLPEGTPIYAQVDSLNTNTTYGSVFELDEVEGQIYYNIFGPITSTLTPGD